MPTDNEDIPRIGPRAPAHDVGGTCHLSEILEAAEQRSLPPNTELYVRRMLDPDTEEVWAVRDLTIEIRDGGEHVLLHFEIED